MVYVCSDLHGQYGKYRDLLEQLRPGPEDTLYLLGDLLDRGPEGLRILLDAASRPNVVPMLGNHEFAAAMCLPWLMEEITRESLRDEQALGEHLEEVITWQNDGGSSTIREFSGLSPERRREVVDLLMDLEVYAEFRAGGRSFVLVHAGLDNFSPRRELEDYRLEEMLFHRPDFERSWFPDRFLVVGHTPTRTISGKDEIWEGNGLIDVDCGCGSGGPLGCLCLDTMEKYYF